MRNLLAFLAAATLTVAGIGWYLDWYKIQSTPTAPGRRNVNIDIDSKKIEEDVHKGVQKGEEKLQDVLDKKRSEAGSSASEPKVAQAVHQAEPQFIINFEEETRRTGVVTSPPGVGGL